MNDLPIFKDISSNDITKILKCFSFKKKRFKNDEIILSNINETNVIGIVLSGYANMIRYDYNGNRNIIENLEKNSLFGKMFSYLNNDASIIATSDCEVLLFDYDLLMHKCVNNCSCHTRILNNIFDLLSKKVIELNERLEVLSKRSIRDKLLCYLTLISKKKNNKSFSLPITYTELADYLSVDRSAMMREIKKLKTENILASNGRKINILLE